MKAIETSIVKYENLRKKNEVLVMQILDFECRSMKYNLIFSRIQENTIEKSKLVLVEFQRELGNDDDAFELANVHRFGKRFKTRHTCTLMVSKHDSDFVHKKVLKLQGKSVQIKT